MIYFSRVPKKKWAGRVLIDASRNSPGSAYRILFSNNAAPTSLVPRVELLSNVEVWGSDGALTQGPIRGLPVDLQPMEIQILAK